MSGVEKNSNGINCKECESYSNGKGCKISKVNPVKEQDALLALRIGKLCQKGSWKQKVTEI